MTTVLSTTNVELTNVDNLNSIGHTSNIIKNRILKIVESFKFILENRKTKKCDETSIDIKKCYGHVVSFTYFKTNKNVKSSLLLEQQHYIKFANTFNMFNKLFINCLIEDVLDASPRTDVVKTSFNNIKTQLHPYQINNVNWMINIEKNVELLLLKENKVLDGNVLDNKVLDGNVLDNKVLDSNVLKKNDIVNENATKLLALPIFRGGGLFDEVGMGKTLQTITLINENKSIYNKMFKNNKLYSKATLGIIPNHLCGQWSREFEKHQKTPIKIIELLTKHHYKKYSSYDLINADVVIVSSRFFINCELEILDSYTPLTSVSEIFEQRVNICGIHWHRVFMDEFHEIESDNLFSILKYIESDYRWIISGTPLKQHYIDIPNYHKTYGLKDIDIEHDFSDNVYRNNYYGYDYDDYDDYNYRRKGRRNRYGQPVKVCKEYGLKPIFDDKYYDGLAEPNLENIEIEHHENTCNDSIFETKLRNTSIGQIINYLTFDVNAILRYNLEDYEQYKYVLSNFSRNMHINNVEILKLPTINEKVIWLKFSDTERMIYNSHLVDENNQMADEFLRQICCHPMLCEKLRETVRHMNETGKTFSLIEMQGEIKKVYLNDYENANKDVIEIEERIKKYELRKKELEVTSKQGNIEYANIIEDIAFQTEKLVDKVRIRDGKSKTLQYYINFIDILKDNKKIEKKECPICLCNISVDDVAVSTCAHMFCYTCIHTVITQSDSKKCPTCNKTLRLGDIFLVNEEKVVEEVKKEEVNSDVDKYGTKLAYIINYIKSTKNKYRIIYSQWDDLLREIGKVLNENGIKSLFCMGNVYQKDKVLKMFNSMSENENDNCKVIMLSSKHTISGSNLSNAEEVIFIDPFYGEKQDRENMRNQAIGRVRRLGNKFEKIDVIDLLIKDTVEENIFKYNTTTR